ncbi:MAG: 50S ribosomal protein L6 [Clostridiales bacterium]|jgi:large subunit ribosomal protein L6|nr:50S ribosomal protein L6 [Clostridiales bacterium]
MSRIGKMPIDVPDGVEVNIDNFNLISVRGPKGLLTRKLNNDLKVFYHKEENKITVDRPNNLRKYRELHGLTRTLINNMIIGVTQGFSKILEINGVGYRAIKSGNKLTLTLGYSHPVILLDNADITTTVEQNKIIVFGINKEKVGQYAANIRFKRPPEPYKGKGIKYLQEKIRRKVGKTGKK